MTFLDLVINPLFINFFIIFRFNFFFFFIYLMPENLSAKIMKKIKKNYRKEACQRYANSSKVEKEQKQQYGHEHYKKVLEVEKFNFF